MQVHLPNIYLCVMKRVYALFVLSDSVVAMLNISLLNVDILGLSGNFYSMCIIKLYTSIEQDVYS